MGESTAIKRMLQGERDSEARGWLKRVSVRRGRTRSTDCATAAARAATAVLAALCVVLAWGPVSASAALRLPFDGEITPTEGSFGTFEANSVAADDSTGSIYVGDSAAGVIDIFNASSGIQIGVLNGSLTPAGSFGGGKVAVAANDGTGDVYVSDSTNNVIDEFDSAGNYLCQITGSATPSATECNGATGSQTPAGHFSTPSGLAVDEATGEVYVLDARDGVVDVFSPAGAYLRDILLTSVPEGFSEGETRGVAISDFNQHAYVADAGRDLIYEFDATGSYISTWAGANTPAGSFGGGYVSVAADNASGDVYVTDSTHAVVDVFEASGSYITGFGHSFNLVHAVTVDPATEKVYVSDTGEPSVIDVFGPPLVIPDVTTGAASEITPTTAVLGGTVNPDGVAVTDCRFDYGTTTSYGAVAPCVETVGSGNGEVPVHADISSLQAGTTYHFRLEASNANGTTFGEDASFSTPPPPTIDSAAATNITATEADLTAQINPNGFDTTYHFEWGATMAYGTSVPPVETDIGAGTTDVGVTAHLTGLTAGTTYHWRIVARNQNGLAAGSAADHTFVYERGGTALPDNRAYEIVTPPDKNGALIGDVLVGLQGPQIAEDGSRVIDRSIQCFAEAQSCNAARQFEGEEFAFERTSGGWITTPLAPSAERFAANTPWEVNPDAATALYSMPTPPSNEDDFYVREPNGTFADIGPATPPAAGEALGVSPFGANVLLATADLGRLVWESQPVWPFDSGNEASVYEYGGRGNVEPDLVGVSGGRGSTDLIGVCGTNMGGVGHQAIKYYGSLSSDGETVFFTARRCASGSGANAARPVPADTLYARLEGLRTVMISGRSPDRCTTPACLSSPVADAQFEGASANGMTVFFTSTQQLTDAASEDEQRGDSSTGAGCSETTGANGCNLYGYDLASPPGDNLLALSAGDSSGQGPRVQGVMAISPDSSHVYFVAKGVLTGAPNGQGQRPQNGANNLYAFERDPAFPGGHTLFITALPTSDREAWAHGVGKANVTPDGRYLVFTSHAGLTPDTTRAEGPAQVYRFDAASDELTRISIGEHGFNDNGNAGTGDASIVRAEFGYFRAGPPRPDPTMSHDGSYVFFESPVGLVPQALDDVAIETNGALAENVYEWREGQVHLISDGRDASATPVAPRTEGASSVLLLGSDATGANVFFRTADQLVPQDTNTGDDYYDARICAASSPCIGPPPQSPVPCNGDGCQGTPTSPPTEPGGGSSTLSGSANLTESAVSATAKVRHTRHGVVLVLTIRVSDGGTITVTGPGVKRIARSFARAGAYEVRIGLTSRASARLRRRHTLPLRLHVAFTPADGASASATDLVMRARAR
jgi:DNA-binding beta-propeller fold protein YncE